MKEFLRSADIILFHTKGFSPVSWGIRLLTESFWNHTSIVVIDNNTMYCIEALGNGVVKTPIEKYENNKNYILKAVRVKPEAFKNKTEYEEGLKEAVINAETYVGHKYDWWAIVWLGLVYLAKGAYKKGRQYIPIGNPLQSRNKFFCSELVCSAFYGLSLLHPQLFEGKTKQTCDTTTPKDINKSSNVETIWGKNDIL